MTIAPPEVLVTDHQQRGVVGEAVCNVHACLRRRAAASRRGIASLPVKTMTSPDKGPPSLWNYALRRLFEGLRALKRRRR
jgi:hypothetical protein